MVDTPQFHRATPTILSTTVDHRQPLMVGSRLKIKEAMVPPSLILVEAQREVTQKEKKGVMVDDMNTMDIGQEGVATRSSTDQKGSGVAKSERKWRRDRGFS